jgi:HEAT repeat protein
VQALNDVDWGVRWTAAKALGQKRGPQVKQALMKAIEDNNSEVKEVAKEALKSIGCYLAA